MAIDGSGGGGDVRSGGGGNVGGEALVDEGDAGNVGGKGDRGGAAPMRSGGSIVMPLICTARSAQLLRQ